MTDLTIYTKKHCIFEKSVLEKYNFKRMDKIPGNVETNNQYFFKQAIFLDIQFFIPFS
jgi:hypothetical protein